MTTRTFEHARTKAADVQGSWFSTFTYDLFLAWAERSGMAARRQRLLASARGRVLEIGAGTGLNLAHYPEDLGRLTLTEPEEHMASRLERRAQRLGYASEVVRAPAEVLPFQDESFDTVVVTLVLCTVGDSERALAEIRRVLAPGGSLLFLEHVQSDDPRLARRQDRLHDIWHGFADGCNCNRRTLETLSENGFQVEVSERAEWRRMPAIVRPLVSGRAIPA